MTNEKTACPHCRETMLPWMPPLDSSWDQLAQLVCFNDECEYFVKGWKWMEERYGVTASYRHRHDPHSGESGPLPVWSLSAHRDAIVPDGKTT